MKTRPTQEEAEAVRFDVEIDLETVGWLCELAEELHVPPAIVAASILRDVRRDDQMAEVGIPTSDVTLN